jgi:hypothetical protein
MARKKVDKPKRAASMPDPAEILPYTPGHGFKSAVVENPAPAADESQALSKRERIELLAYRYWEQRGRPGGSPDEDWFRAELEIDREFSN